MWGFWRLRGDFLIDTLPRAPMITGLATPRAFCAYAGHGLVFAGAAV